MSKTPRVDDREFAAIDLKPSSRVVYASFARQLETELADARAEIERIKNKENEADALLQKCLDLFEEQVERGEGLECRYFKKGITDE